MQHLVRFAIVGICASGLACAGGAGEQPDGQGGGAGGEQMQSGGEGGDGQQAQGGNTGGSSSGGTGGAGNGGSAQGGASGTPGPVGTESQNLGPLAPPFAEAPAFRAAFDDNLDKGFAVLEGGTDLKVEGGSLQIGAGKAGTVVVDASPAAAPGDVFTGDLTIQFRVKGDTTPWVPPQPVAKGRFNEAWLLLPQGNRASAPRISFRWSESDEDELSISTGADATSYLKEGTNSAGLTFATPAYAGDVWYTLRVTIKPRAGGQATVRAEVYDGAVRVMEVRQDLTGFTANGEIAFGGKPGIGGRSAPLLIDDLEVWKAAELPALQEDEVHRVTAGGSAFAMWIPPGLQKVNGIYLDTPGAGGETVRRVSSPWFRAFARMHGYAIVGHAVGPDPAGMLQAIDQLASVSKHDELKTVPIIMTGFSRGARNTIYMMNEFPQRLLSYVGDSAPIAPTANAGARKVPGVYVFGENDTTGSALTALYNALKQSRAAGGYMAVLEKQGLPHTPLATYLFVFPYFDKVLRTLHPDPTKAPLPVKESDAWLLETKSWRGDGNIQNPAPIARLAPASGYSGDASGAGWFLNKDLAYLGAAYTSFRHALVVSPIQHAKQGEARQIRIRHRDTFASWEKIELYDYGKLIHTFASGDPLLHEYANLEAGIHAISAHMTFEGKVYPSFPIMVMVEK